MRCSIRSAFGAPPAVYSSFTPQKKQKKKTVKESQSLTTEPFASSATIHSPQLCPEGRNGVGPPKDQLLPWSAEMRVASLPGIVVFKVALQSAIACRVNIRFPLVDNAMPPGNGARQNDFSVSAWNNAYTSMQCVLATYL